MYLLSIGAGILVGVIYGLMNIRSPAPPLIALLGLLGILLGEQIVPAAKRLAQGNALTRAWFAQECVPKITGIEPIAKPVQKDPLP